MYNYNIYGHTQHYISTYNKRIQNDPVRISCVCLCLLVFDVLFILRLFFCYFLQDPHLVLSVIITVVHAVY